jgi:ubiquinone/menaquinone biosynthesis C-methylase UbiE
MSEENGRQTHSVSLDASYVPALRYHALTGLFDPFMLFLMRDQDLRDATLALLRPPPGERVLDLGCGTGTLAIRLKQEHPRAIVVGCDIDPAALAIASRKATDAQVAVTWRLGGLSAPPFPDRSFDLVVSTLLFHHLRPPEKVAALATAWRLLKPQGRLVLADFSRPEGLLRRMTFGVVRFLDGGEATADHAAGRLNVLVEKAGFEDVTERSRLNTFLGTIVWLCARKRRQVHGS